MVTKPHQYQLIYESLKRQLVAGKYPKGELLPSENELSAQFQTTRTTVRQALAELVRDGYIERRHGKGSVVRSERKTLGLLSFQGFSEIVGQEHSVHTVFLQPPTVTNWPDPFFYPLTDDECPLNCLRLDRMRYADNSPVMLEYTWVPNIGLEALLTEQLLEGSLFRTLHSQYQLDIRHMEQRIRAVSATTEQADLFNCLPSAPLLYIERRYQTNQPGLHVYSKLYCFTEQYAISGGL